jgi:hypothetical protein
VRIFLLCVLSLVGCVEPAPEPTPDPGGCQDMWCLCAKTCGERGVQKVTSGGWGPDECECGGRCQ